MAKVKVFNQMGEVVEEVELLDSIFAIKPNVSVMHDAVVNYLANQRQGTFAAKTRAEVRGGGRKPFRQKGTGRARQGSIRAPHYVGGGVVFAKKPRDFSYKLPKKVRRLALKSAFSDKVLNEKFLVLDKIEIEAPKTKKMIEIMKNLNIDEKTLIVLDQRDLNVEKSANNIKGIKVLQYNTISTYNILNHERIIVTKEALEKIEEVYK